MLSKRTNICMAVALCCLLQNPLNSTGQQEGLNFTNAANQWQATPVDGSTEGDSVAPSVRAQRNAHWQPVLSQFEGLTVTANADPSLQPELVISKLDGWLEVSFD